MHVILKLSAIVGFALMPAIGLSIPLLAQSQPPPTLQKIEESLPRSTEPQPLPIQTPQAPPPPRLKVSPPPPTPEGTLPTSGSFLIKRVEVLGSTVLQDEIAQLIKLFENRSVTFEELIDLRSAITQLYIDNGYITSGAFLPSNQQLDNGVVQIQVIQGELENIEITGLTRLRDGYVRSRMKLATRTPLNQQNLERGLQLLQLDPLLEQVNAELTAGSVPGRSILRLNLKESPPFSAGLEIANDQPPSTGSIQGSLFLSYANLTGFGDTLFFQYGRTEGVNSYDIAYAFPFNAMNGTFNFSFSKNDNEVVEDIFQDLGIRSLSDTLSFSIRQPLVRSPETEFALGIGLDLSRSQTYLLDDIPFSFSLGPEDGRSRTTVIRFFQDWVSRGPTRVLAARSQFSFGVNAFDATINDFGIDGRFFAWLGQFQWVQQIASRNLMIARINAQLTPDALLPLEQFTLGGLDTVRGYIQNQLVTDNGILASLEFRIPLTGDPRILQLTPFFDLGTGWNNLLPNPDPKLIAGIGVGLRWQIISGLDLLLEYGFPLVPVDNSSNSLQAKGFYFLVRYQPF